MRMKAQPPSAEQQMRCKNLLYSRTMPILKKSAGETYIDTPRMTFPAPCFSNFPCRNLLSEHAATAMGARVFIALVMQTESGIS